MWSNADKATKGFIVEPGEYNPETVLLIKGFLGSFIQKDLGYTINLILRFLTYLSKNIVSH